MADDDDFEDFPAEFPTGVVEQRKVDIPVKLTPAGKAIFDHFAAEKKQRENLEYEIEILKLNIELYGNLQQQYIEDEKVLPVAGRTLRFEEFERLSGLKTAAKQRLSELNL